MTLGDYLRRLCSTKDERGRRTSDWFRLFVRRAVRNMVSDNAGSILDAGGGDGLLFDPNVSRCAGVTTILDMDIKALHEVKRYYGGKGHFAGGDLTRMPFEDGSFGTAVCIGTFYNFPSADMVFKGLCEMARVTGKEGRMIVEFRNAENPLVSLAYKYAGMYDSSLNGLPLNAYSLKQIKSMLSRAGLEAKRIKTIGIPLKRLAFSYILETVQRESEK